MKDFPVFTTENGVASLILKEIPYRGEAYIHLRDSQNPQALLEECVSFCTACGAKAVYAAGNPILESYPLHTAILEMRGVPNIEVEQIASLFPVTETTAGRWRELHNRAMAQVPNAGTLEQRDEEELTRGGAYFIHRQGELLGIGYLKEDCIVALAACKPGAGKQVLHSLCSVCPGVPLRLEVASNNERAIGLYERMGFLKVREISRWYRVQ